MVNIGVLGYGVVGSGVVEIVRKNGASIKERAGEEIVIKKILDIRDFPQSTDKKLLTKRSEDIFEDDSIKIVVETIGGVKIAYDFTKKALQMGKHVVTSNKELVASHGPELLKLAEDNNASYLFEASVGGGIPIIRPLNQCLAANEITAVTGILNGTTNYILTRMLRDGMSFERALALAQKNGYAEADPSADIEGHDACRKIAILSSIAYNEFIDYKKIHTEGISKITLTDMKYAEAMNSAIKLVAISRRVGNKVFARVSPMIIQKAHPLSNVDDVYNAIVVNGDAIGEAMFYGRGAGKLPTASAVAADIIDIVRHGRNTGKSPWKIAGAENMIDPMDFETSYFIRIAVRNIEDARMAINNIFGDTSWIVLGGPEANYEIGFVSGRRPERELQLKVKKLAGFKSIESIVNTVRVLE